MAASSSPGPSCPARVPVHSLSTPWTWDLRTHWGKQLPLSHVQVQPVTNLKRRPRGTHTIHSSSFGVSGEVSFLSWSPCLLCQACVSVYFVSSFPIVSQLTRFTIRQSCWNRHSHTAMCPHQWAWLTSFGSHLCLPYYLCQICVPVCAYSGFLICFLSLVTLKKVLDLTFEGADSLLLHTLTSLSLEAA